MLMIILSSLANLHFLFSIFSQDIVVLYLNILLCVCVYMHVCMCMCVVSKENCTEIKIFGFIHIPKVMKIRFLTQVCNIYISL
jgi:hypothetical protein